MTHDEEVAEAQLLEELGVAFRRVGNSLQVTTFDPFKIESLSPADSSYTAHFVMDKVWKKLVEMRIASNNVALAESSLSQKCHACRPTGQCDACKQAAYDSMSASLSSPPLCLHNRLNAGIMGTFCADCGQRDLLPIQAERFMCTCGHGLSVHDAKRGGGNLKCSQCQCGHTTFRQSPSLTEPHSGKQNTADKSGLLPTQLPKDK